MAGIIRQPTSEEQQDYKPLNTVTTKEGFLKMISQKEYDYTKEHKPFDGACARADFEEEFERLERESLRRFDYVNVSFVSEGLKKKFNDLDKYGEEDLFEKIDESEDLQDKVIEGSRTQVSIGFTIRYKCKRRGHGISVFMPTPIYNKWKEESAGNKKVKKVEE